MPLPAFLGKARANFSFPHQPRQLENLRAAGEVGGQGFLGRIVLPAAGDEIRDDIDASPGDASVDYTTAGQLFEVINNGIGDARG